MILQELTEIPDFNKTSDWPSEQVFENELLKLKFHQFNEVRMGLEACRVEIEKNKKKVEWKRDFLATIPRYFEPFSNNGEYSFIPTCPVYSDPHPILLNNNTLDRTKLNVGEVGILSNHFSRHSECLILVTTSKIMVFDFQANSEYELNYSYKWPDFPTVLCSSNSDIILIVENKSKEKEQFILAFDINQNKVIERQPLRTPSEVFDFELTDALKTLQDDSYRLFHGGSAAVGYLLNKWSLSVNSDGTLTGSTLIPTSNIYPNSNWDNTGIDVSERTAKLNIQYE